VGREGYASQYNRNETRGLRISCIDNKLHRSNDYFCGMMSNNKKEKRGCFDNRIKCVCVCKLFIHLVIDLMGLLVNERLL
jgi:hypothetical protein